jgi:hypothetical protein
LFKFQKAVGVFADTERRHLLYEIKADRLTDFSARYHFIDADGRVFGAIKRRGLWSIWQARYDIYEGESVVFSIQEKNAWVKMLDAVFAAIPMIGVFTSYFFNPSYLVSRPDGTLAMTLEKRPTFLSRIFTIKQMNYLRPQEETQVLLSLMMMLLLERQRQQGSGAWV